MSRDVLLYGGGKNLGQHALAMWAQTAPIHKIQAPDAHRLQVERFVYDRAPKLGHRVMDVGQSLEPRRWVSEGYFTFGLDAGADVSGSLLEIPFPDSSIHGIICTEVLEHCADPFQACREMHRVLVPGGHLVASTPFCWPDHATSDYPDYWRFTEQGWELLLKPFKSASITPCEWTDEGLALYNLMRRFECFGFEEDVFMTTGYMVEATK